MKIIGKISICFAILSYILLMVCSIVTSTYAWQNTNEQIYDIVVTGSQSYNITPIKAMYMTMPRSDDFADGYYNRSIQHQNVYQLKGKSNFREEGLTLSRYNTEVQNNYSDIRFGDSDVGSRLWGMTDKEVNRVGLIGLREEDGLNQEIAVGSLKGQAFDLFRYETHSFAPYQIRRCSYVYQFNDFVISQKLLQMGNVLTIQPHYIPTENFPVSSYIIISYTLMSKNHLGEVTNTYTNERWDNTNNMFSSYITIEGVTYDGYYTTYDIGKHIYEDIPKDQREYVQVSDLQIYIGSNWEETGGWVNYAPDKVDLNCTYYRPYIANWDTFLDPFDTDTPKEYESIDYKNLRDYNRGTLSLNTDGFETLGEAIGNTTNGIFNTEILPGITIWTLLLIPLSLGIIFALLRYFAGG